MADGGPQLSLVVLRVRDLVASRSFYERIGVTLRTEQHGRGPIHLSAALGDVVLEVYPRGDGPPSDGARLGFIVRDLDDVTSRLDASEYVEVRRDGEVLVVAVDPDGHKVELAERRALPPGIQRWFVDGRHHLATWVSAPDSRDLEIDDVEPGLGRGPVAIGTVPDDGGTPTVRVVDGARPPAELLRRLVDELGSG